MRPFILGLLALAMITGCTTGPDDEAPPTEPPAMYTIQAVVIEAPTALATNGYPQPLFGLDASHVYPTPKRKELPPLYTSAVDLSGNGHQGQIGDAKGQVQSFNDARAMSDYIEHLMKLPEAKITKFPEARLAVGDQYVDDATETRELPDDYEVVDGKTIVTHKSTFKTGQSIHLQLTKADTSTATYQLKLFVGRLKGFESYTLSNGDTIQMPFMESRSTDTQLTQPLDTWFTPGGLMAQTMGDNTASKTVIIAIHISKAN